MKKVLPAGDRVLYIFYVFETTQNTRYSVRAGLQYLMSSAYTSSVRNVKMMKMLSVTACDALRESTRSGKTL